MADSEPAVLVDISLQASKLRIELKAWENTFAAANNGRKAGREDIKQHPEIAEKYKAYNKLRVLLSTSSNPQPSSSHTTTIARYQLPAPSTPRRPKAPPLQSSNHPSTLDPYDASNKCITPNPPRTFIGPTPQKNGLILGLFDLLSPQRTFLNSCPASVRKSRQGVQIVTPSKRGRDSAPQTPHGLSSVKKQCTRSSISLEARTPTASRTVDHCISASRKAAVQSNLDVTPEFLRRTAPLAPSFNGRNGRSENDHGDGKPEDEVSWSPVAVRLPRKPVGRGLSALVKGLRCLEEEKLDAELDILKELEEEGSAPVKKMARGDDNLFAPVKEIIEPARIEIEDSQRQGIWEVEMPLGADGEGDYSTEEDAEKTNEKFKRQRKAWKKKGQKRSTRQVIMRPTLAKWKPEKKWDNEEEDGEGTESTMKETQVTGTNVGGIGEESEPPDEFSDDHDGDEKQGKEDSVKAKKPKPPRKTSATAHANFRALKIKNKQSKGKRGGKFGRRRY